ncbi:hypothetical protein BpHYR1_025653 [Brachionus plicatilis]|uniref:Uncharacterized protein n=1 Tax=Brachionus plicatilis TaxID=10195 RepID=A0A3M7SU90_BRAPC|nr:hypothetical protein BpHYR1_025653 [Brachionus plicatilis]
MSIFCLNTLFILFNQRKLKYKLNFFGNLKNNAEFDLMRKRILIYFITLDFNSSKKEEFMFNLCLNFTIPNYDYY